MTASPFISRLRESTQAAHRSLEQQVPLMSQAMTRATYIAYLNRVLGYHQALEHRLKQQHSELVQTLQIALRVPLLKQDLQDLHGFTTPTTPESLPELTTLPQVTGVLYVFEGSTLGGQMIRTHLQKKLSLDNEGTSYFAPYGSDPYPHWRQFQGFLQTTASDPHQENEIISSAINTFTHFEQWLQHSLE